MSAALTIVQPDRVHMLADAAFYAPDGTLTMIREKVWPVPGIDAAFSSRGFAGAFELFDAACTSKFQAGKYHDFDGFRRAVEEIFRMFDKMVAVYAPGRGCEVVIAGWSTEYDEGQVLFRHIHDHRTEDTEPGKVYLMGKRAGFGPRANLASAEEFDPHNHGIAAFEEARRNVDDLACGNGDPVYGYSVGGFVSHAVITPGGMTRDVIHEWPEDRVGEKIVPERVAKAA